MTSTTRRRWCCSCSWRSAMWCRRWTRPARLPSTTSPAFSVTSTQSGAWCHCSRSRENHIGLGRVLAQERAPQRVRDRRFAGSLRGEAWTDALVMMSCTNTTTQQIRCCDVERAAGRCPRRHRKGVHTSALCACWVVCGQPRSSRVVPTKLLCGRPLTQEWSSLYTHFATGRVGDGQVNRHNLQRRQDQRYGFPPNPLAWYSPQHGKCSSHHPLGTPPPLAQPDFELH